MKTQIVLILSLLLFLVSVSLAMPLPQTLAGIAPGEKIEAYYGKIGYPSLVVEEKDQELLTWGDGLMLRLDGDRTITEIIITRPGRQVELDFDLADDLSKAIKALGEGKAGKVGNHKEYVWSDESTGISLTIRTDNDNKIERLLLLKRK